MMKATDPAAIPDFVSTESLLSAIINSSDDAIVSKNLNGIVTSWNPGAERIFGYTAAEMVGQSVTKIIPEDRLNEEPAILQRLRNGERVDHFYTQRRRKDGTLVDVSLTISPMRNAEGVVVGASKIARDVSQQRRAEEMLREQNRKLAILNEVGTSLSAERELETLVQKVTDAGRELSQAAFGAFFYNVLRADGEAYMLYTLSGAPREAFEKFGMPRKTEVFGPTFDGEGVVRVDDILKDPRYGKMPPHHGMPKGHLPVRSYLAVPVISRAGTVLGGLFFGHPEPGIFTDEAEALLTTLAGEAAVAIDNARLYEKLEKELEQQRRTEKALRESEELSSSVLNSTADCIKVMDLEGNLLSMNPPGLELFHLDSFDSLRNRSWIEIWPPAMRDTIRQQINVAKQGGVGRFDGACPTAKGVPRWWDVIISPLRDSEGKIVRLTATSRDVTEQRRAVDEARAASIEAERQSRMKDEFLATLSHELRTPLQSILGWTQLLRGDSCDPEEVNQGLEVIDRNARAQTRIIEDLLDMSRILSGKVRLDVQRVDLASVIQAALQTVEPAAQAKEIRLHSVLDPVAQPVSGDPNRLQQIFWNLLSNAIKFTPRGGRVQVLLERVNSHLEVSVIDTGAGISPEFLPYVFERFRQADASSTRRHGGLGLGLAIARHLAELHGGSIRAKSGGLSTGATFTVVLPLAVLHTEPHENNRRHPAAGEESTPLPHLPDLSGVSVLVVDDEEDARNLVGLVLTKAGAEVRTAGSAKEARDRLAEAVPHVLISDIGMPGEDGHALMRSIRTLPPASGGRVAAIALSAYTRTEDRIKAISAGFQMHLPKPADGLELLTMVESLARQSKSSAAASGGN